MVQHGLAGVGLVKGIDMSLLTKFSNILNQQNKEAVDQGLDSIHGDQVAHQADRARDYRGQARTAQFENVQLANQVHDAAAELAVVKAQLAKEREKTKLFEDCLIGDHAVISTLESVIRVLRPSDLSDEALRELVNEKVSKARVSSEVVQGGKNRLTIFQEGDEFSDHPDGGFFYEFY